MPTFRYRAGAVLLVACLVLAACATGGEPSASTTDDTIVSSSPSPGSQTAKLGVPFRTSHFEVTVTKVETGIRKLDVSDAAKSRGLQPWTPANGQYVLVHLTVKNLGNAPASYSTSEAGLVDDAGRTYISVVQLTGAPPVDQGLGIDDVQPGASASGFIMFDVPTSAGIPVTLVTQPRPIGTVIDPSTAVNLRG
jgi:hypothetical protein